jgi:hypothetical protein
MFYNRYNTLHTNKKWFYVTKVRGISYISRNEEAVKKSVQSKRFITMFMCLCVVGCPTFAAEQDVIWDGKVGVWPIMAEKTAEKNSRWHKIGDKYKVPCTLDAAKYEEMLVKVVMPAIKMCQSKLPKGTIFFQHDNAPPHSCWTDKKVSPKITEAIKATKMDIQLKKQPPNLPDLNVNDLGVFSHCSRCRSARKPRQSMN